MFIQIIEGTVADAARLRRQFDSWLADLRPGATGWLGSTGGITADGQFVMAVRFDAPSSAEANAARPAQGAWWSETETCFEGPATFHDTDDVRVWAEGSDGAGFVQMMQARVADRERFTALTAEMAEAFKDFRPDSIGHVHVWLPDGRLHVVDWFTSETEARAAEKKEPPADLEEKFGEWMGLCSDVRWIDLPDPWLASP